MCNKKKLPSTKMKCWGAQKMFWDCCKNSLCESSESTCNLTRNAWIDKKSSFQF